MSLVAFGCSFTFGQGLPDIHHTPLHIASPSIHAWPQKLAEKLNSQSINKGIPGSGNLEIFNQIINYPFNEDDICVILWSQFVRHDFFRFSSGGLGYRVDEEVFLKTNAIEEENWLIDNRIKNWLTIHHASLYLKTLNIKYYSLLGIVTSDCFPIPNLNISNFDGNIRPHAHWFIDRALDFENPGGGHPGIKSHICLANIFYDKLTNHVLY